MFGSVLVMCCGCVNLHKIVQVLRTRWVSQSSVCHHPHLPPSASTTTICVHHPSSKFLFSCFYTHAHPLPASTTIHVCTPTRPHATCPQVRTSTIHINKVGFFLRTQANPCVHIHTQTNLQWVHLHACPCTYLQSSYPHSQPFPMTTATPRSASPDHMQVRQKHWDNHQDGSPGAAPQSIWNKATLHEIKLCLKLVRNIEIIIQVQLTVGPSPERTTMWPKAQLPVTGKPLTLIEAPPNRQQLKWANWNDGRHVPDMYCSGRGHCMMKVQGPASTHPLYISDIQYSTAV